MTIAAALLDIVAPAPPSVPNLVTTSDTGISNTDNLTSVTTPTFVGKAEANATVTLFAGANATVIGQAKANSAGAWSITTAALAAGVHAISARATDQAGNISAVSGALSVTIDPTSPAAPTTPNLIPSSDSGASNSDDVTNRAKVAFNGKAESGATITLYDGTAIVGTGRATISGLWSITSTALSDGFHLISAQASDRAGNASAMSGTLGVTIDTKAPLAPSKPDLVAASDDGLSSTDNITSDTTPTFTGTAAAHATITLLDGTTVLGSTTADAAGKWSVTATPLALRLHTIRATATDQAGNVSAASAGLAVSIDMEDTVAPAAPTMLSLAASSDHGSSSQDDVTNVAIVKITGKAEPNATITLYEGSTVIGTGRAAASGSWGISTVALSDGVHQIAATATDRKGNVSVVSPSLMVTIETVAPAAPTRPDLKATSDDGVSSTNNITTVTRPTFTGQAEAHALITLLDGTTVVGTSTADAAGNWSVTTMPLAYRVHSIRATATDLAGNVSSASAGLSVTIDVQDTTAPDAPTTPNLTNSFDHGRSNSDNVTNTAIARFNGKAEPGATVTLYDGETVIGTGLAGASGTWIINSKALADGVHAISATATDRKGNISARSAALAVTIDTVAPTAPATPDLVATSDTGGSDTDNITSDTTLTLTGSAEANAVITLYDSTQAIAHTIALGSGLWSLTTGVLAEGAHALKATATDLAGNVSAGSGVLVVNIDLATDLPAMIAASAARMAEPRLEFLATPGDSEPPSDDVSPFQDVAIYLSHDVGIEGFAAASVQPVEPLQTGVYVSGPNSMPTDMPAWITEPR